MALEYLALKKEILQENKACKYPDALIKVEQAVICILHCENRCGEKIFKMALTRGWAKCGESKKEQKEFQKKIEHLVNTRIFGKWYRPANWRMVVAEDKNGAKCVGDQSMPNTRARQVMNKFDEVIDLCIEDAEKDKWKDVVEKYRKVIEVARKKEDFTDDEINKFSDMCDDFFRDWVTEFGRDGITNYIHAIGAGHLTYFLRRYGNLYRYSNQGWEGYNGAAKWFFFHRTQRGGYAGKPGVPTSKAEPIGLWIQRKMFWESNRTLEENGYDRRGKKMDTDEEHVPLII